MSDHKKKTANRSVNVDLGKTIRKPSGNLKPVSDKNKN